MGVERQQSSQRFDVAIAGGSHAGLALALALVHLAGPEIRVAVIERSTVDASQNDTDPDPRAFAIAAASRLMLDALGVWTHVAATAQPVTAIDITDTSLEAAIRPVLLSYDNMATTGQIGDEREIATHIVEAELLRQAFAAEALRNASIAVLARSEVTAFEAGTAGVDIALQDGRRLRASLLIAADGAKSPIRLLAGIKTSKWSPSQVVIVTTVTHERSHNGRAVQHFLPSGPFAMLPLSGNRTCVTWTEEEARGRAIVALDDRGFLAELEQRFGFKLGGLSLSGRRGLWPLELHIARTFIGKRLALIGDAARTVHPIAGQGLNLGFRDVAALAEVVVDTMRLGLDPADAVALERYEQWRRFDTVSSAAGFGILNTMFSIDSGLLRMVRSVGLGLVDRLPGLKQMLIDEAAGLTGEVPRLMRSPGTPLVRKPQGR